MGRTPTKILRDPYDSVREKARGYVRKGRVSVHVFSTAYSECDKLRYTFGGGVYRHRTGWLWIIAKKKDLLDLVEKMRAAGKLPSQFGFEQLLEDVIP